MSVAAGCDYHDSKLGLRVYELSPGEQSGLSYHYHDEQAVRYADYIVALRHGKIQARGTPEEVITEELLTEVFRIEATVE